MSLDLPENFHLAVIMDGNGRWGALHKKNRVAGHEAGMKRVEELFDAATEFGVKHLTLFAFSTENWKRSEFEVQGLMMIFRRYITNETKRLLGENVRVKFIGDKSAFSKDLIKSMEFLEAETANNDGLFLNVAMNYGGHDEITRAVRKIVASGVVAEDVTDELIAENLDTAHAPNVDLMVRTSGEQRISNFVLWKLVYAELYFTDVLWPDFGAQELKEALEYYNARTRRFGGN